MGHFFLDIIHFLNVIHFYGPPPPTHTHTIQLFSHDPRSPHDSFIFYMIIFMIHLLSRDCFL